MKQPSELLLVGPAYAILNGTLDLQEPPHRPKPARAVLQTSSICYGGDLSGLVYWQLVYFS